MPPRPRTLFLIALLSLGAILWAINERAANQLKDVGALKSLSILHVIVIAASIAVAAIPQMRTWIFGGLNRLRHPSLRAQRRWTAAGVCIATIAYIALTAALQGRDLIPKFHDEHLLLVQVRLLSEFRLWAPQHPLADFFESFHIFVKPKYASVYFPGASMLYVPGIWLGLKFWMIPLLIAGLCAAFVYRITTELIDGVAGLLAALMLVSLQWFRYLAMMVMSQNVLMLAGLLLIWSWLRWRKENKLSWAMAIGACAGWMAITRPVDALAYAIPVAVAMLIDLRRLSLPTALKTAAVACLFAVPFFSLQVIENLGITGKPFETPYRLYANRFTPGIHFGFHDFDSSRRPQTNLPQRQIYYDQFTVPAVKAHRPDRIIPTWLHERFPTLFEVTLPNRLFLLLMPLAILAFTNRSRGVLSAVLPLYVLLYAGFAYLLAMYCVVAGPSVIAWVLLGKEQIERWAERWREAATVALTLAIVGLTIVSLPEIHRDTLDDGFAAPSMWFNYVELPKHVQMPAIVLYRFHPGDNVNEEPVYNIDVVNPDDAPIIRAHDLGLERDRELFDYYAQRQPTRTVYLYDRSSRQLVTVGNVAELSRRLSK